MILIPLVLWGVFRLTPDYFAGLTAVVVAYAAFEFGQFVATTLFRRFIYLLVVLAALAASLYVTFLHVAIVASVFWLLNWLSMAVYSANPGNKFSRNRLFIAVSGCATLTATWQGLVYLRQIDPQPYWLLFTLFLVWFTDMGAYFSGRLFGLYRLAPSLSPKKTWEGLWGGCLIALLVAWFFNHHFLHLYWLKFIGFSLLISVISVLGDLYESLLKRQAEIKDSGVLLPGHGGLLDRIDALLPVLPIMTWILITIS